MTTTVTTRLVWPELPTLGQWTPYYEQSVRQNWYTNSGPALQQLERRLEQMYAFETETVLAMSSATVALSACLIAHNIKGPVICPAFTFQATAGAILGAGCRPVITDVDSESALVTPSGLADALKKTQAQAAMIVVPYGIEVDLAEHIEVCRKAGARLVIDNAAGLGIDRKRRAVMTPAPHVDEVFSLHATKVFGVGEGGAVFTAPQHAQSLRSAINFGINTHTATGEVMPPFWGINGKMAEAMAAIGLAVADQIGERVASRQRMAQRWIDALHGTAAKIFCDDATRAPWQVFPILLDNDALTTEFANQMLAAGMETRRYYKPSLGDCRGMTATGPCPNAADLSARAIVLPVRSWMPEAEQLELIHRTREILVAVCGAR